MTASTNAALNLLERLYKRLDNNWLLALAAYNAGEGNVRKAIRKNKEAGKPIDFWSLKLPRETRAYPPKLLALARIYADPEKYNIKLLPIKNEAYFDEVDVGSQIDLAQAARLADVDLDELYMLNPGFNRWATSPEGPHSLLVPVEKAEYFRNEIASFPPEQRISWKRYTVAKGDTLGVIAQRHNTSVKTLKGVNKLKGHIINIGDTLMIPVASAASYSLSENERLAKIKNTQRGDGNKEQSSYKVKSGDSFWSISRQYNVSMKTLAKWNGMAVRDPLRVGQELVIWTDPPIVTEAPLDSLRSTTSGSVIRKLTYRVRSGDSLSRIGNKFKVSAQSIARWNNLNLKSYIRPGQRLTVFVDVTDAY